MGHVHSSMKFLRVPSFKTIKRDGKKKKKQTPGNSLHAFNCVLEKTRHVERQKCIFTKLLRINHALLLFFYVESRKE